MNFPLRSLVIGNQNVTEVEFLFMTFFFGNLWHSQPFPESRVTGSLAHSLRPVFNLISSFHC